MKIPEKTTGFSIYAIYGITADGVEETIVVSQDLKTISKIYNQTVKEIDSGNSKYQDVRMEA